MCGAVLVQVWGTDEEEGIVTIKAIETVYNGYKFRSRLEARWAVFFDALNIEYEYEPEGYDLGEAGWYLPDFWIPRLGCWVEIKGQEPSDGEVHKIVELAMQSQKPAVIFIGSISTSAQGLGIGPDVGTDIGWVEWRQCVTCHRVSLIGDWGLRDCFCSTRFKEAARMDLAGLVGDMEEFEKFCRAMWWSAYTQDVDAALLKARQARFEHGESGG